MSTEFQVRVQYVLDQVRQAPPAAREQVIRDCCGDDARLQQEVRELLPHYLQMAGFEPPRLGDARWRLPGTTTFQRSRAAARAASPADREPQPPFAFGRFKVVQILGRGGMGTVYRAVHPTQDRSVAIKLLRHGLLTADERRRFTMEEAILRQLRHPGIAQFTHSGIARFRRRPAETGPCERRPYLIMEYIAGQPLTRFAARHELDARQRLALLIKVCAAVGYAHERGVVHCDLKPENILVDSSGQPKVLDFGIARLANFTVLGADGTGGVGGTLLYASPEQLQGRADLISPASDVYALGVITHELLTGERPLRKGDSLYLRLADVRAVTNLAADHARNAEFRVHLQAVLAAALRQVPGQVVATAGEFGAELTALLAHAEGGSRWAALIRRLAESGGPAKLQAPDPLSRPLSAVLRKRIDMALSAGSRPAPDLPPRQPPGKAPHNAPRKRGKR